MKDHRYNFTHQISDDGFDLALHDLHVFGGPLQGDPVLSLGELNVHLDEEHVKLHTVVYRSVYSDRDTCMFNTPWAFVG